MSTLRVTDATAGYAECMQERLDRIVTALGGMRCRFLQPGLENALAAGAAVADYGPRGMHGVNVTARDVSPYIRGHVIADTLNGTDEYITVADDDLLSFGNGLVDQPFSIGLCFKRSATGVSNGLIAKYDSVTPDAEYVLYISNTDDPTLLILDDSVANGYQGRSYTTTVPADTWQCLVGTYSGVGGASAAAGIRLYLGDPDTVIVRVDNNNVNGAGAYVAMENTTQPVSVGAWEGAGGPAYNNFFSGDMALKFITGYEMGLNEVREYYNRALEVLQL